MERANIFGYPVHICTQDEALNYVVSAMHDKCGMQVVTINPEMIMAADKTPELASILRQAELVIPDSVGIMLAIKSMGIFNAEKIPGVEFAENLLKICAEKGFKAGFLGGAPDVIEKLNFRDVNVVFAQHGYFKPEDEEDIVKKIQQAEPQLLLVGLGCPKQEYFINKYKNLLNKTVMIGVGGSFDVWTKKVKRAPIIFQNFGLEWFYRLITQPDRFNRMFPVLPLFFLRILFDRKHLDKKTICQKRK